MNITRAVMSIINPFVVPIIRTFLSASMEYVSGFPSAISLNIGGIMLIGYIELLAKNRGIVLACPNPMNLSLVFMNVAIHTENAEKPIAVIAMAIMASIMYSGFSTILTPINRAIGVIIRNCMKALMIDAEDLPSTMAILGAGVVNNFFNIPDSLSYTIVNP
jgi:hypothetical protein